MYILSKVNRTRITFRPILRRLFPCASSLGPRLEPRRSRQAGEEAVSAGPAAINRYAQRVPKQLEAPLRELTRNTLQIEIAAASAVRIADIADRNAPAIKAKTALRASPWTKTRDRGSVIANAAAP
jgi:hypothetical protein